MLYLRDVLNVPKERILWVMPTNPWITCRDPPSGKKQNTCMEFLNVALEAHAAAGAPADAAATGALLQRGFETLEKDGNLYRLCLLYTSPSPRDRQKSRMPSSA